MDHFISSQLSTTAHLLRNHWIFFIILPHQMRLSQSCTVLVVVSTYLPQNWRHLFGGPFLLLRRLKCAHTVERSQTRTSKITRDISNEKSIKTDWCICIYLCMYIGTYAYNKSPMPSPNSTTKRLFSYLVSIRTTLECNWWSMRQIITVIGIIFQEGDKRGSIFPLESLRQQHFIDAVKILIQNRAIMPPSLIWNESLQKTFTR